MAKSIVNKKKNHTQIFSISLVKLQTSFERIKREAGWDIKDKLFWGYYFLDHNQKKLDKFAVFLKEKHFHIVEIRNTEKDNLYILHIEENVVHTAESLLNQCQKLAYLAVENNIEIFDGWDVEKINLNKGFIQ